MCIEDVDDESQITSGSTIYKSSCGVGDESGKVSDFGSCFATYKRLKFNDCW